MLGKSSGQAALEYLMTYGWALVIVVTVSSILFAVGIKPAEQIIFTSSEPTTFIVKTSNVTMVYDNISFAVEVINATAKPIVITRISYVNYPDYSGYPFSLNATWDSCVSPLNCSVTVLKGQTIKLEGTINRTNYEDPAKSAYKKIRLRYTIDGYVKYVTISANGNLPQYQPLSCTSYEQCPKTKCHYQTCSNGICSQHAFIGSESDLLTCTNPAECCQGNIGCLYPPCYCFSGVCYSSGCGTAADCTPRMCNTATCSGGFCIYAYMPEGSTHTGYCSGTIGCTGGDCFCHITPTTLMTCISKNYCGNMYCGPSEYCTEPDETYNCYPLSACNTNPHCGDSPTGPFGCRYDLVNLANVLNNVDPKLCDYKYASGALPANSPKKCVTNALGYNVCQTSVLCVNECSSGQKLCVNSDGTARAISDPWSGGMDQQYYRTCVETSPGSGCWVWGSVTNCPVSKYCGEPGNVFTAPNCPYN